MKKKEELLKALADCVCDMEDEEVIEAVHEYLEAGYDAQEGLLSGLVEGMKRASDLYEEGEYFVPELIVCSDAMYAGIEELQKAMPDAAQETIGKVVIGVVEGDTHDIGKNLVRIMLETGGFEVYDLGRDVPPETVVEEAIREHVPVVGLSALMTTTVPSMEETIKALRKDAPWVKVMVGGAVLTQEYADAIGADAYCKDAMASVNFAASVIGK